MNARGLVPVLVLAATSGLPAQSFRESTLRLAPQSYSYSLKTPISEKVSEFALPFFVVVPVLRGLTVDVGTAWATAHFERQVPDSTGTGVTTTVSDLSGMTDTQLRASYSLWQDLMVVTAGVNVPTGSATVEPSQLDAATRIGSDFLSFPISGFGSGLGLTGGLAVARPAGGWNLGFAGSMRHASEYEPFRDASGAVTTFQPGLEVRTRLGADHAFGAGRISLGVTYSKFGDDKANAATFNSGDRYLGQVVVTNALRDGVDYTVVVWNLYRSEGTLINQSASPAANITNALVAWNIRGPADVSVEPSVETRVFTQQNERTSFLANVGLRLYIVRGAWAVVPGFGFSLGLLDKTTVTGARTSLAVRLGR